MKRLVGLVLCLLLTGCDLNVTHWALPGGTATGASYSISAVFQDVGSLTVRSQVRSRGIAIGDVTKIALRQDHLAQVTLRLKRTVQVPTGSQAELATASLLGATYVDLVPPSHLDGTFLAAGAEIPEGQTGGAPEVEQVLAAMSAVLNGSGLSQVNTIVGELDKALTGRGATVRDLIAQLQSAVRTLDGNKQTIVSLIDSLHSLSARLAASTTTISKALTDLAPGMSALSDNTDGFTVLLTRLAALGVTAKRVVAEIHDSTVADLQLLNPLAQTLASVKGDLARTADQLALAAADLHRAIPGDYINLKVTLVAGAP